MTKRADNSVLLMVTLDTLFNDILTNDGHPDTTSMKKTLAQQVHVKTYSLVCQTEAQTV